MNSQPQASSISALPAHGADSPLLQREVAIMAGRFAQLLRQRFADDSSSVAVSLAFLEYQYREHCGEAPLSDWPGDCISRLSDDPNTPVYRLITGLELQLIEVELLILAGLAEEHEGFADIFRTLHPTVQPLATLGLAAQLLCNRKPQRQLLRQAIESSRAAAYDLFITDGENPFFTRSLRLPDRLWSLLKGVDAWPQKIAPRQPAPVLAGLNSWFEQDDVARVQQLIASRQGCSVLLFAESVTIAANRALALCAFNNLRCVLIERTNDIDPHSFRLLQLHCVARGVIPVLEISRKENAPNTLEHLNLAEFPLPVVICAELGAGIDTGRRPTLSLQLETLDPDSLCDMWQQLLPELATHADQLAARYPFEPDQAKNVCDDLHYLHRDDAEAIDLPALADAVRTRSTSVLNGGVKLVRPIAGWDQLVLQEPQLNQLKDASHRLFLQSRVLNEWQFLKGRRGARGVRLLFAGPPGTGKTLSAEVLAQALNVDLLQVDLSRVVSKWIGETEKNLADVFLSAESAKAVLFFDEADALFGKRTEVSDAHDRYANLETAYLLSRLERYDGLAILATNYRQNIDTAFSRRLDFIVEFEEPGCEERKKLWQCHLPEHAPLDKDVSIAELASLYPIVGGHIRNAAVAAAYLAAQENTSIKRRHFVEAIRREYEKAGKAHREISIR